MLNGVTLWIGRRQNMFLIIVKDTKTLW